MSRALKWTCWLTAAAGLALLAAWWWNGRTGGSAGLPVAAGPSREAPSASLPPLSVGFRDEAPESGIDFRMHFLPGEQGANFKINLYDHGCGVAVADFDGDGWDDLYFLNQLGPNALYRNLRDGTFEDVTEEAGPVALDDRVCVGATFGDYDNDGDQDLYVTSVRGGNVLFENTGEGRFQDVTESAGVSLVAHSQTAAFFDYDNDQDLDLFVTNTAQWTTDEYIEADGYFVGVSELMKLMASPKEHNVAYRNNGDRTFSDVTADLGLAGKGWGGDVAVFDFDEDGWQDLLVTNMFGMSQLYRNDAGAAFQDVTRQTLGQTSFGAIGAKALDINNDGRLDLCLVDMHSDMWVPMRDLSDVEEGRKYEHFMGPQPQRDPKAAEREKYLAQRLGIDYMTTVFGNTLFKNLGQGRFEEISDRAHWETFWPWGIATGDFDNDGLDDVFLPSGMGYPYRDWPNRLLMNEGNEKFSIQSRALGVEPPRDGVYLLDPIGGRSAARSSRCAATADFDGDGRLELVVSNFNDRPYYFRNHFPQRNYVAFRLTGTHSNRDAVGATVRLHLEGEVMVRQVHAAGGYLSQSSKTLHFGLGERTRIDRAEVRWPTGQLQTLDRPAINTRHDLTEP
jgi:hypothetical protein